ncbi:MAG: hypothetical protein ACRBBS_17940 [Thalassovita sp.]
MRLLAAIITLGFLGLSGLAGHALLVLMGLAGPQAQSVLLDTTDRKPLPPQSDRGTQVSGPQPPEPIRFWPALFGEPQPPAPQEPVAPPKEPPTSAPPKPPLSSLGYTLKGVVSTQTGVWATVGHPAGGRLLRQGDELEPGIVVARINKTGIWISRDGDPPELLAFPDQPGQ